MNSKNFTTSRSVRLKFVGLYLVSITLIAVIFYFLWRPGDKRIFRDPATDPESTIIDRNILIADALLHSRISRLQLLYQQYIKIASDSTSLLNLDSINTVITNAENSLKTTIDSLDFESRRIALKNQNGYTSILSSFRSILQSSRMLHDLQAEMTDSTDSFTTEDQALLGLQQQLIEKELRIADLESQIRQGYPAYTSYSAPSNDQTEEEEYLKSALTAEKMKTEDLTANVNSLKNENEILTTQLNELRKSSSSNDATNSNLKNRNIFLERQVEDLSSALRFAKIDCNLSRADAQQIISSARQRKDLLIEALTALNDLSRSKDVVIQEKAKDKMNQLNRIATTLRD